jgi:hypothetical protein
MVVSEGDQVNASSSGYGRFAFCFPVLCLLYHQITVCSNGFIALGETGMVSLESSVCPERWDPAR